MQLNSKTRIKQKYFWTGIIGLVGVIANNFAMLFGVDWTNEVNILMTILTSVLGVFVLLGIVVDPTTEGLGDSTRAMTYNAPKTKDQENVFIPKDFNNVEIGDIEHEVEVPDYSTGGGTPEDVEEHELDKSDEKALLKGDVFNG